MPGIFRKTLTPSPYKYIQNSYGCPFPLFDPDMERCQFFFPWQSTFHRSVCAPPQKLPSNGMAPDHYRLDSNGCLTLSKSPITESQESNPLSDICWSESPIFAKSWLISSAVERNGPKNPPPDGNSSPLLLKRSAVKLLSQLRIPTRPEKDMLKLMF